MRIKYAVALIAAALLYSTNSFGQGTVTPRLHLKCTPTAAKPGQIAPPAATLSADGATETVTIITSVAQAVDLTASHLSLNYDSNQIRDLPGLLPVDSLARLAPGTSFPRPVTSTDPAGLTANVEANSFSINGGRTRSNGFTLDGHDNNDIDGRPVVSIRNFDAVDMLHVITTRATGDLGTAGTSINLTTRSGTNDFHGSVFDYHLNSRLSARSLLERRSGLDDLSRFRSDIFGGTFGGPIRRDRIFFFGAFEREAGALRRFVDSTSSTLTPTARGLEELSRRFPNSQTVSDLIARGPLARSTGMPRFSSTHLIPVLGEPVEFGEIIRSIPSDTSGYEGGTRFDFEITNRNRLQVGYWYDSHAATNSIGPASAGYAGDSDGRAQLGGLRWTRLISPQSTNVLSFSVNRARLSLDRAADHSSLSAPLIQATADPLTDNSSPGVSVGFRGLNYGDSPLLPSAHLSTLFETSDTLSHIRGRHNLKLGAQVRARLTRFDHLPGARGQFTYASFDDFVQGSLSSLTVAIGDPRSRFSELHNHVFVDDLWRSRSNLTLSMGVSYENTNQPVNQLMDRIRERESDPARALFGTQISQGVLQNVSRDKNNIAPRFGFAYTPRFRALGHNIFGYDKTVIRGGASVSYDQTPYRALADVAASAPNVLLAVIAGETARALPGFPRVPDANQLRTLLGDDPQRFARTEMARSLHTPYSASWHLDASRDFDGKVTFEIGYAGSRGASLLRAIDGNPFLTDSDTFAGPVRVYESSGRSIYHSLQSRADVRLTESMTGGVSYTFSKLIDDLPDSGVTIGGGVGNPASLIDPALQSLAQNLFDASRGERALSSLDRRHSFNAHFVWSLPLRRGHRGFAGRLLSGWKASGIIEAASGSPFTPLQFLGNSRASSALFASMFSDRSGAVRPFVGNPVAPVDAVAFSNASNSLFHLFLSADGSPFLSPTGFIIANRRGFRAGSTDEARFIYNDFAVEQAARSRGLAPDAFGQTFAAGRRFGDAGRNILLGSGPANVDFALLKTTKLSEKVSLQFRSEFFNLFNHPNRAAPNNILENAGGYGFADPGETDATPRRIRIALKLIF